jgi:uncharacterized protein (TIGR03437 family)
MLHVRLLAALALCGYASAQAPVYSSAGIVNASDYSQGPFAPNSVISIFGTGLSWGTDAYSIADVNAGRLPSQLAGVQVHVSGWVAPLLFVSPNQINFLMPSNRIPGKVTVSVVRQSLRGPDVELKLEDAAPALFDSYGSPGFVIAQQWLDWTLVDSATPAHAGDDIILYATGLGPIKPGLGQPDELPARSASLERLEDLRIYLDGSPIPRSAIAFAGIAAGSPGVYQIGITLPDRLPENPEIRVAIGSHISAPGLRLALK